MGECTLDSLTVYPLKGAQGVGVKEVEVRRGGIVGDRQVMLVKDGENYAQRDHPQVATVAVDLLEDGRIALSHPAAGDFTHEVSGQGRDVPIKLLHNAITTLDQGDEIAAWACAAMKEEGLRVVSLPKPWDKWIPLPVFERIDGKPQAQLYDVAPLLVNNQASLDDFNTRTSEPVPMDRFRANVVVGGLAAYEEDDVERLSSDEVELLFVTACERCVMTTTDQQTGVRANKEPIKTLSSYRRRDDKYASGVVFGSYMTPVKEGALRVGDQLAVEKREARA
jgi:uncharacterized protein YcbX